MIAEAPQDVACAPLADAPPLALAALPAAFSGATPIALAQSWLDAPDPSLAPTLVRTAWRDDDLLIFAELTDTDIFTRATGHGQRFWELGDTFEMFFQPQGAAAYVELHVTPNNQRLHLRFPSAAWRTEPGRGDAVADARAPADAFRSWTWLPAATGRWYVLAAVPSVLVSGRAGTLAGATWRFSFARYDYTRGVPTPVISSSSPHTQPAFHRPDEWRRLHFVAASAAARGD